MESAQKPASSKRSTEVVSDTHVAGSSSFDNGVLIPVQLATLNTLAAFFKDGQTTTDFIEQQLKKDMLLSGFMEDYYNRGTELFTEREAKFRGSLGKCTTNKRVKMSVGEVATMPHGSGKTNIDGTTYVEDMLEDQLDEAEATNAGSDELDDGEPDDDETDDDELDDGETDDDELDDGEPDDDETDDDELDDGETDDDEPHDDGLDVGETYFDMDEHDVNVFVPETPIESIMNTSFFKSLAEKIANDGDLNRISLDLLKTVQNGDAQQHYDAVDQFWKNEHFRRGLCQTIPECNYIMYDMSGFAIHYIAEPPEQKLDRVRKDSSFEKVLGEKDHVVKMSGILGIIIGYWIKIDMLVALAKELDASDTISPILRRDLGKWLFLRKAVEMSWKPGTFC